MKFTVYENVSQPTITLPDFTSPYYTPTYIPDSDYYYIAPATPIVESFEEYYPAQTARSFEDYHHSILQPTILFTPTTSSSRTSSVVDLARSFVGGKYVWGGINPKTGFDCSGFVLYVYKQLGVNLPRTVRQMEKVGQSVSKENAKPGDLVIQTSGGPSGRHARLVSKVEDGLIWTIDARGTKKGIVEEPLSGNTISIRRVV